MNRRLVGVAIALVAAALLLGAFTFDRRAPTIPDAATTNLVARAALAGDVVPDATANAEPEDLPRSPSGGACLDSIERPAGVMSLCWQAWREGRDADPINDYYRLRVFGTFGGDTGSGVRWAVVRTKLLGEPSNQIFETWPHGTFEGACTAVGVALGVGSSVSGTETLCGRTTASTQTADWSQQVTWICESCLFPDHADRALALHQWVAMPEGGVPSWDIFADLGS